MLENSTQTGSVVLDLFGGSGSTLIACEKMGRRARLMELDEKFCDVIIRRWQEFTGRQAILEGDGRGFEAVGAKGRAV
jgi:DNA modification methylase